MRQTWKNRLLALALVFCTMLSICTIPASAASIADGSKTCSVALAPVHNYLQTTAGTWLRAGGYNYKTNDGLAGPAYCIDHGLSFTDKVLPITGKYDASPATAGAFANGYPQHSLETFLGLYLDENAILSGLTEDEYRYATQVAVWATLGQLGVDGTPFTSGREYIQPQTGDTQQQRVFRAVQLICNVAKNWDRVYKTGMYIRLDENELGGNEMMPASMTLEGIADQNLYGIKLEVINGKSYYTKEYIFASATSTYYNDYGMEVWATGCPAGTIFTSLDNQELARSTWREIPTWRLPTNHAGVSSNINSNGFEYRGKAKLCIPADTAPPSGEITIHCAAAVMQYEIYLANNESNSEQSYIIADPSKGTLEADAVLSWGGPLTEVGYLLLTKVDGGGLPLAGAKFTLSGTDGKEYTGTTDDKGQIFWQDLDPTALYTITETEAPAGFSIVGPRTVTVNAAQVTYETVKDDPLSTLTIHKIDRQNGYSLRGAVYCFEQVDGTYKTTATTDHAGLIQLNAEKLPIGSYKVYEVQAPDGFELDPTPQTVNWDGKRDVTLTFKDTRKPTLIISKQDSRTKYSLPGASFAVYKDGSLVTTVTTNDNGLAYVSGLTTGYYEVREVTAPEGYTLNDKVYGVNIDLYDPATDEDPRLVVENDPMPSLRIVKYDRETGKPLKGTTFKVYRDAQLFGTYTTGTQGDILLTGLEPGTYAVEEINATTHVADAAPQQIEVVAGRTDTATLVFFNSVKPGIHIRKVDADTLKPLKGGSFQVSQVGGSYSKELQTDENGEIDLSALEPGAYTIRETVAPAGYLLDDTVRTVQVKAGENAEFVFTDSIKPGLHLIKRGEDGKPLEGATFRIAAVEDGSHVYDRTTDKNGEITITGLEPGVYSVTETIAPKDYILDGKEHHVELTAGKVSEIILTNTLKPSLRIVKYDRQSHKAMEGVTFEVFKDTVSLGKYQTNAQGEILLPYVDPGTYKAVEVDVGNDTHILTTSPQEVELHAGDGMRELVFFNDRLPGLHLVKVDSADLSTPIPNAKFRFESVKGDYGPVEFSTEKDGTIDLSKLPTGAYVVTELECPGYVVDDAQRIIQLDGNETAQFVFTNTRLPSFKLTKTGADGKPLEGVTFRIAYVEDGTHYMDKTTDVNGQIVLDGLEPGVLSITETATLPNYILDPTEHHVELTEGKTATIDLQNDKRPNLIIYKRDADTEEPVPGTVFVVKKPDGHSVAEVTTGQDGSVTVPDLLPGVYEVEEKSVPAPYLLDAEAQTVTLYANHDREVTFKNHKKPTLTVNKVDSVTGDPIQGAKFNVTYASNNTSTGEVNDLGTFYSDANGRFYIDSLRDGWYKVTELESAKGYAIQDPATQEVYIKGGESKTLNFKNVPLSALVVYKYDSVTGLAVKGAVFQVKYLGGTSGSGGTVIGTYKTSANGSFTVTGLQAGTYVVEELASDSGHVIDTAPQTAYISGKDQDVAQLYFGNSPKASLTVRKIDSVSHKPLSDVEFLVTLADGSMVGNANGKFITDSAGSFTIDGLTPGVTLVVKETRAKDGYILDDAPQTITVKAGQAASLEFRNAPMGALVITKQDSQTRKPLSGATFKITTSSGQFVAAQGGAVSSNGLYTTDKNGQIVLTGLEPDTYVVTETKAPSGYELDSTPQTVAVNAHDTQSLFFYNDPTPEGGLRIVKLDEESRQPIKGVTFEVRQMDGKYLGTYRTDSKGIIRLSNLTPGWYTVTETKAAEGYALDEQPRDIEVKDGETAVLEVTNRLTGSALIHKVDAVTGKGIYGVTFLVSDAKGYPVGQYTTDQDGYIYIQGELADGRYTIREIQQAEGYLPDTTVKTFWVEYGACSTITWKNTPISGQIQITKTSADYNSVNGWPAGTAIPGTEFEVYNRVGALVDTIRTDKNGVAVTKALPLGRYTLVESKAAENYLLDKTPITAEIEFAGQIVRTAMTNKSVITGVSVTKIGYAEVMPGQTIRYTLKGIANTSTVALNNFYWRDTLPSNAVRLSKVVTGTWNAQGSYKLVYRTNLSGNDYRTLADNLSTTKNYTLDASPVALRLAANEYVTEVMAVFGVVPAGFRQVEVTKIDCTVVSWLTGGAQFANQADVGGTYNGAWVQATSRWVTKVYAPAKPLPRTGY